MVKSNCPNSHETYIFKFLVHLNNLKEGPIPQNIQTVEKTIKKINIKKAKIFAKFSIRLAFCFEIAVDHAQTFEDDADSEQPCPYLVQFWLHNAKSPKYARN